MKFLDLPKHHAILLVDIQREKLGDALWDEILKLSLANKYFKSTVLDIDMARSIISWAQSPYHEHKHAVISFHTATLPAQNALLKILEEPPSLVSFILVTSHKEHILDTVISRLEVVTEKDKQKDDITKTAHLFLEEKPSIRMKLPYVVELLAREDEEGRKDRERVRLFLLDLAEGVTSFKVSSRYAQEVLEMASYASDPSTSCKAILEYVSLLLPQTK
jgi:DNA polymerase III delta prime subunit